MKKLIFCMFTCTVLLPVWVCAQTGPSAAPGGLTEKVTRSVRQKELFFDAVARGDEAEVRRMVSQRMDVDTRGREGASALMLAPGTQMLRVLLELGADVNLRDDAGDTALIRFCRRADGRAFVKVLLEAGADINVRNGAGESALDVTQDPEVEKLLVAAGAL